MYIDELHQATVSGGINVPLAEGDFTVEEVAGTLDKVIAGFAARAICDAARSCAIGQEIDLLGLDSETIA